jgi:hypothetical protein
MSIGTDESSASSGDAAGVAFDIEGKKFAVPLAKANEDVSYRLRPRRRSSMMSGADEEMGREGNTVM